MLTEIAKYDRIPEAVAKIINEQGHGGLEPGAVYATDNDLVKVLKIVVTEEPPTENSFSVYYKAITQYSNGKWSEEKEDSLRSFNYSFRNRTKLDKSVEEYTQMAKGVLDGKVSLELFMDEDVAGDQLNEETALIHKTSKAGLQALQAGLEEKRTKAELMKKFVGLEMEKRRREMERFRSQLGVIITEFEKKITKIMRVITTIELYLGINEELFQIQAGEPAPADTTISFRQAVLYMDEEIGHWKEGGLDWTNIDWFDKWLTEPKNLQQVFPEKKGVVVFRPRRYDKDYNTDDVKWAAAMNRENKFNTYILVRNGDNLYRVYTENIVILPRLFPRRAELADIMEKIRKESEKGYSSETSKDKINDMMYQYRKRAILLQGLIDRTEVFHPLPAETVNIFNLDELGNKVQFIYDDEASLPTGRLPWKDFIRQINSQIKQGSRVFVTGNYYRSYRSSRADEYGDRFYLASNSYDGLKNVPDLPNTGVYQVEEFAKSWTRDFRETEYNEEIEKLKAEGKRFTAEGNSKGKVWTRSADPVTGSRKVFSIRYYDDKKELTIMYLPSDQTAPSWDTWETQDRKNRTRFKIYQDDSFVVNYDQISLGDLEFYRNSRVDRPNYLHMMRVIELMIKWRKEELDNEAEFAKLATQTAAPGMGLDYEDIRSRVWESIRWWKYKNQWKRPIKKDDTLALRMIVARVKNPNYSKLEHFKRD